MATYNPTNPLNTLTGQLTPEQLRQYQELMTTNIDWSSLDLPESLYSRNDYISDISNLYNQGTNIRTYYYGIPYMVARDGVDLEGRFEDNRPRRISNIKLDSPLELIQSELYSATGIHCIPTNMRLLPPLGPNFYKEHHPVEYSDTVISFLSTGITTGKVSVFDHVTGNRFGVIAAQAIYKIDVRRACHYTLGASDSTQMVYWTPGLSKSVEPPTLGPVFKSTSNTQKGFLDNLPKVSSYSTWMLIDNILGEEMKRRTQGAVIFSLEGINYPTLLPSEIPGTPPLELNPTFHVLWERGVAAITLISSFHSSPLFTNIFGSTGLGKRVSKSVPIQDRSPILQVMEEFLNRAAIAAQSRAAKVLQRAGLTKARSYTTGVYCKLVAAADQERKQGNPRGASLELLGETFRHGKKLTLKKNVGALLADRLVTKTKMKGKGFSLYHKADRSLLTYEGETIAWIRNPGLYVYKFRIPVLTHLFSGRRERKKILWYFRYLNFFPRVDESTKKVFISGSDESYLIGEVITIPNTLVAGILSENLKEVIQEHHKGPPQYSPMLL